MPRSRLKVLFLVESLSGGGAEKVLSGLVRGLDRERFDVRCARWWTAVRTGRK